VLMPGLGSKLDSVADAKVLLSQDYVISDDAKFYRILHFVRDHVHLVKGILMIQASSAESERFFSYAKMCTDAAPSRELRTISDMAFIKSYFESIGFEEGNFPENWSSVLDAVSRGIHGGSAE